MNKSPRLSKIVEVSKSTVSTGGKSNQSVGKNPANQQTAKAYGSGPSQQSLGKKQSLQSPSVVAKKLAKTTPKKEASVAQAMRDMSAMTKSQKKKKKKGSKVSMNPYLESLLDPFNTVGAKIPDDQAYPSAPFKMICRVPVTVNAQGIAGCLFGNYVNNGVDTLDNAMGSLIPIQYGATQHAPDYIIGQYTSPSDTDTNLFVDGSPYLYKIQLENWSNQSTGVPQLFNNVRLVSAGLSVHYSGTPLNAQGRITCVSTPKKSFWEDKGHSGPDNPRIDDLLALPGAISVPVNDLKGAIALYKPVDYMSYNYCDILEAVLFNEDAECVNDSSYAAPGVLCIVADGCEPGTEFLFTFVGHYEGIPRYSTLNLIEPNASPNDPLELAYSMNVIQQTPSTVGNANAAINTSRQGGDHQIKIPRSDEQPKQGTTLQKVINGIGSVSSVVQKVAPLAMELLAMI